MKESYLFGSVAALLVVVVGVILIGKDGTDNSPTPILDSEAGALPLNTATNTEEVIEEPVLEPEETTSAPEDAVVRDLEDIKTPDEVIVSYNDAGFSPKTITIEEGDMVTFVNSSSRNMWVASNIHPTHNEYPEESNDDCLGSTFDACRGVPSGESWSFVFSISGEWGYHDHLNASRTGTVVVE
jgi:plastocyanin